MADTVYPPGSAAERLDKVKATEHQFAQDARNKGAEVFEFDPKATTEQKTAQVKKVHPKILSEAIKPCSLSWVIFWIIC